MTIAHSAGRSQEEEEEEVLTMALASSSSSSFSLCDPDPPTVRSKEGGISKGDNISLLFFFLLCLGHFFFLFLFPPSGWPPHGTLEKGRGKNS